MKKWEETICSKDNVFLNVIKQKTVHSRWYWWARIRVAKWLSFNTWKIEWDSEKVKYIDKIWPWTLMFTNQRMVFMSMEKNVTIKASDIIQAEIFYDGITLADEKWTYHFTFDDDWWEFCNKFIKHVKPDSPLLPQRDAKQHNQEKAKSIRLWIVVGAIVFFILCAMI